MSARRKIRLRKKRNRAQRRLIAGLGLCAYCEHWGTGASKDYKLMRRLGMCWNPESYYFKISVAGHDTACDKFEPIGGRVSCPVGSD